ncbi:MAG: hypothetical protein IJV71_00900 [Lachnospiraceae bacterium]|nr:hypothetical protein [Lachnospiraceae bacterium]
MRYRFNQQFFGIESVRMELYDCKEKFHSMDMSYDVVADEWYLDTDMEISRYKYIVNDIIRLNDPMTNQYIYDEKWEVWSVPTLDAGDKPYLATYNVSNSMCNGVKGSIKKTEYVYDHPFDIYIGVDICKVKGLHSLTYICFQPDGRIYMLEESSMGQFEPNEADYEVVFKNRVSRIQGRNAEGMWSFAVYLDGKQIIKDYFVVKRKIMSDMVLFDCKM